MSEQTEPKIEPKKSDQLPEEDLDKVTGGKNDAVLVDQLPILINPKPHV